MKPDGARYEHDGCDSCQFRGQVGRFDVWTCLDSMPMLRFSDTPEDYQSMLLPTAGLSLNDGHYALRRVVGMIIDGKL